MYATKLAQSMNRDTRYRDCLCDSVVRTECLTPPNEFLNVPFKLTCTLDVPQLIDGRRGCSWIIETDARIRYADCGIAECGVLYEGLLWVKAVHEFDSLFEPEARLAENLSAAPVVVSHRKDYASAQGESNESR